jgi:hypothetical protein
MRALWAAILLSSLGHATLTAHGQAMVPSPALGKAVPSVNIPARIPLPSLSVLSGSVLLDMGVARITVRMCSHPGHVAAREKPWKAR